MEITLSIPQNKWKKPTEVRTEIVQAICDAFLKRNWWYPCIPYIHLEHRNFGGYRDFCYEKDGFIKFYEVEMHAAFKALQNAGWHIFKHDAFNGTWYEASAKDYTIHDKRYNYRVIDFNEQWD